MKLLNVQQIREWDAYTILHEPVRSIDLMERAARAFTRELILMFPHPGNHFIICCGTGNNGGDGLAIARMLAGGDGRVDVLVAETGKPTDDFNVNLQRLNGNERVKVSWLREGQDLPRTAKRDILVDAVFGTGLSRRPEGDALRLIQYMNSHEGAVIAVDVPSGFPADLYDPGALHDDSIVHAAYTFTFQVPRQGFMHAESYAYTGEVRVLDIGLAAVFNRQCDSKRHWLTAALVPALPVRGKFSHKGTFGHALCIGGSYGKLGAALLMSRAALHTGCGLVTAYVPKVGYTVMQGAFPEAMVLTDGELYEIRSLPDAARFDAIGIGPGMGVHPLTMRALSDWLPRLQKPCVIDADALNMCSSLLRTDEGKFRFPKNAILTPHPREFDRLAGPSANSVQRLEKQIAFATMHEVIVVLKGAHTCIAIPDGNAYFNSTGNPAMATGGSGDVLTGIITSLLAQGMKPADAACAGVYLHGAAGDLAAEGRSAIIASDIIAHLPGSIFQLSCG